MEHPLLSILTDNQEITFKSGEGAVLTPIINNGKITEVVVNSPGNGYNSPPDLVVRSLDNKGDYAILVPIIKNGQIDSVVIQKTGLGYTPGKTSIDVLASGRGSRVQTNVKAWNVNLFEKTFENIGDDDCVLTENIANTSLKFASFYAPRPLRLPVQILLMDSKKTISSMVFLTYN